MILHGKHLQRKAFQVGIPIRIGSVYSFIYIYICVVVDLLWFLITLVSGCRNRVQNLLPSHPFYYWREVQGAQTCCFCSLTKHLSKPICKCPVCKVRVSSSYTRGCTFKLMLPFSQSSARPVATVGHNCMRIL